MPLHTIDFSLVPQLSKRDITYQKNVELFKEFISFTNDLEGIKEAVSQRGNYKVNRELLCNILGDNYHNIKLSLLQKQNLENLVNENTFTIITAHQPVLFTGPIYYIYKIFSVINLCEKLKIEFPQNHFVPVFINGSEDHDFDEIKTINLFGKKITWNHPVGGPIGRFNLEGIQECLNEVKSILGESENSNDLINTLEFCLQNSSNYNQLTFQLVNSLFAKYGLIVANMDDVKLKKAFSNIIKEELLTGISEKLIKPIQEKIASIGFASQAYAREINLFYMNDGLRERILKVNNEFHINNTNLKFTESEILDELENNPERFSPNVVLRPMYEEFIFPNIAYIGGGGELAYWMERKEQFKHFNIFFPVLLRRDSVLLISKNQFDLISKFHLKLEDIFQHEDKIVELYLQSNTTADINFEDQYKLVSNLYLTLKQKASQVDKSLNDYVEAEQSKAQKNIEQIENRVKKSLKKNEEVSLNQIKTLKSKLFPEYGLQERHENFMQFYTKQGNKLLDILKDNLDPLDKNFKVIVLDN